MDNKIEFAQRLRDAMVAAGLAPRPGVLQTVFNTRYWGRSVSFQAVSRWLRGEAIPAQDKLLVLADVLKIEPEILRFGEGIRHSIEQRRQRWEDGVGYVDRETFDAFLRLPPAQKTIIREIILAFAKAHAVESAEKTPDTPHSPP